MTTLFPKADVSEYQADPAKVNSLLLVCQRDLYHGMMEISYSPQDQVILFFVENQVAGVYTITSNGWIRQSNTGFASFFRSLESRVRIVSLPVEGVRIGKMLVEGIEWGNSFSVPTTDLKVHVNEWQRKNKPTLSQVQWGDAEAVLAIPGSQMSIRSGLFTCKDQCLGGERAVARAISWPEAYCEVRTFSDHSQTEAFQEYWLHQTFDRAMEMILGRFSDMSGRHLANSLCEALSAMAAENKWQISFMDCLINDDAIFPSCQAASEVYQSLAGECLRQMEHVIGAKLTGQVLQQTTASIQRIDQGLLQRYPLLSLSKVAS